MEKRVLSKEEFVYMVMEEQKMKKELGIELTKIDDNEFNELLAEIWLEYGEVKKKVKKTVKKAVTKEAKKEIKKVVNDVKEKVASAIEDVSSKTEEVKEKVITKVEEIKSETKKKEETIYKTKDIRRKDGFMQLAFDF